MRGRSAPLLLHGLVLLAALAAALPGALGQAVQDSPLAPTCAASEAPPQVVAAAMGIAESSSCLSTTVVDADSGEPSASPAIVEEAPASLLASPFELDGDVGHVDAAAVLIVPVVPSLPIPTIMYYDPILGGGTIGPGSFAPQKRNPATNESPPAKLTDVASPGAPEIEAGPGPSDETPGLMWILADEASASSQSMLDPATSPRGLAVAPESGTVPAPVGGHEALAAGIAVAGIVVAGTSLAVLARLVAPFFSRLERNAVLDRSSRRAIADFLEANPWATPRSIERVTGYSRATVRYHLRFMAAHGLVKSVGGARHPRFAVAGTATPAPQEPARALVLQELQAAPQRLAALIRRLNEARHYTRSGAWKVIRAAERAGLVRVERDADGIWVRLARFDAAHSLGTPKVAT